MKNKYQNAYYWQNLLQKRKIYSEFEGRQIYPESYFFRGVIYNTYGQRKMLEELLHFQSIDELLGYLRYVFFPTAFFSFTNQPKGILIPMDISLEEIISLCGENELVIYYNYQRGMIYLTAYIDDLIEKSKEQEITMSDLWEIESLFHQYFRQDPMATIFVGFYQGAQEVGEYFSQLYHIDRDKILGEKIFNSLTGLSKQEWIYLYQNATDNIFSSRKFMNTLVKLKHK